MPQTTLRIVAPADFNLASTVRSHGWSDLAPFGSGRASRELVIHLGTTTATITQGEGRALRASLGYRAPFLAALARGPDLEALRGDDRPTDELFEGLLELPGFGPYAAGNMLRLLEKRH